MVSENVSARITKGEKEVLDQLLAARAKDMEERGDPGDASFAGWLRAQIRKEARAAGITIMRGRARSWRPGTARRGDCPRAPGHASRLGVA